MTRYVALFRAINVAGHARIPTEELALLFTAAGALDVTSCGHAGNLLFGARRGAAAAILARVRDELGRRQGDRPVIVLRTAAELTALANAQPFVGCRAAPGDKWYVTFLTRKPRIEPSLPLESAVERITVVERRGREVLLLSGPKRSGFYGLPNSFVETAYGVAATTRNWSTVTRLAKRLAS